MINGLMRKLGYISEKNMIDVAVETYEKNDTARADSEKEFYYRAGNANAIGYMCGRFGIDITNIIKARRTADEHIDQENGDARNV